MDGALVSQRALIPASRRRYLTVLFADLCGSTALSGRIETELYAEMLGRLRAIGRDVIGRHGGLLVRAQGDSLLAIFGQPEAREDDGRRAAEAALELHASIRTLALDPRALPQGSLGLHSGIHAGLVLLSEGDLELGRFELLGPVPNVAARLSDVAAFDEILVSEETLGPQTHFFTTDERRLLSLRGHAHPVPAYRLLGRGGVHNRYAALALRGLAPFVGRGAEMDALRQHLHLSASGAPQFAAVSAGPGMGKTRLVEEFLRLADIANHDVHRGYCESYLSAEPLQPFLQMLRALFGFAHGLAPAGAVLLVEQTLLRLDPTLLAHRDELLRALSLSAADSDTRRPNPERTVSALRDLFDSLAARRPVVVFIDDWQWVDDASSQVLRALRGLVRPIFVLLATRDHAADGLAADGAQIIELAPFSAEEGRLTIERLLPGTDPFDAAEIHLYGGGNPLFIEELCHSAAAAGAQGRPHRPHDSVAWLDSLIESRVARLPESQARIVCAAAIIGNVVPAWLLHRVTGHAEDDPLVLALAEQDFIFPAGQAGSLRFKHGITRDVIYDSVGLRERQAMHRRVAEVLATRETAQEEAYEALAYHYGAGGLQAEAAHFAELAGDKATAASALDRVRTQYRAALAALDELGTTSHDLKLRWISIMQRLAVACVFDPHGLQDGLALFERGVALARDTGDPAQLARAEYWLGYIAYAKGDARRSIALEEHALGLAEQISDERLAAQIRATLGQALASAADYGRALPMLDLAVDLKRRNIKGGGNLPIGAAFTLATKGQVLGDMGQFDAAYGCLEQALSLVSGTGHQIESSVLGWMTTVLMWQGRWADAIRSAERSSSIADSCKSAHLFAMHRAQIGYAEWILTRRPEALRIVQDATHWIETRNGRLFSSLNYGWLSDALVTLGRSDEARRHAARALRRGRALDRIGEAMACRALARAAAQTNDRPAAARYLALARHSAAARNSSHEQAVTTLCEAEIEAAFGSRPEAARLLEVAVVAFESMKMHWHLDQARQLAAGL
jgi:class 3 adenylate cyclase/tetratricopeptide (TPR) repeat protein